MELPVIAVFAVLCTPTSIANPISSSVIPKEYYNYQRQNLPEIPGYIPVYIKHDDETPVPKWAGNVHFEKSALTEDIEEYRTTNKKQAMESAYAPKDQPVMDRKFKKNKVKNNHEASKLPVNSKQTSTFEDSK